MILNIKIRRLLRDLIVVLLLLNQIASYLMDLFEENNVMYQMSELPSKLQKGGGGTIAKYFAQKGIQVIDVGVPVGNMHGKHPTAHIGDLGQLIKGYKSFIGRR